MDLIQLIDKKERTRQALKKYRTTHRDIVLQRTREWRVKNSGYHSRWHAANRVKNPTLYMWRNAKNRAARLGLEFDIDRADIVVPNYCPAIGVRLEWGYGKKSGFFAPNGPSIDRMDSTKGYVRGNIRVISNRANWLKRDGTLDEFRGIVAYMERQC